MGDGAGRDGYLSLQKADLSGSCERLELHHYQAGGIVSADIRQQHSSINKESYALFAAVETGSIAALFFKSARITPSPFHIS